MNKETYERFKQENLGARMAKAVEQHRLFLGLDTRPRPVPNRVARRRMGKDWQRIEGATQ